MAIYILKKNGDTYYCKKVKKGNCYQCGAGGKIIRVRNSKDLKHAPNMKCPGSTNSTSTDITQPEVERSQPLVFPTKAKPQTE
jgi:hypothetical protein